MLKLSKHPEGPELPEEAKKKHFRSYADMADWAEEHLPPGKYWCRNPQGANLWTALREVRCKLSDSDGEPKASGFWVDGRGNI
jgi:hypothetical protein